MEEYAKQETSKKQGTNRPPLDLLFGPEDGGSKFLRNQLRHEIPLSPILTQKLNS
jgi:hypothetical protein